MGISGLLPRILPSAGRENYDLRALSDGLITAKSVDDDDDDGAAVGDEGSSSSPATKTKKRKGKRGPSSRSSWTRRRVRVAVDVNGWIARAAHGHGGLLMDERHLSYRGRAELRDEERSRRRPLRPPPGAADEDDDGGGGGGVGRDEGNDRDDDREARQRLEYISACASTVLRRIEFLVDDCRASVLLVLDGATPPCKADVVRARSDRRAGAAEERDGTTTTTTTTTTTSRDVVDGVGGGGYEDDEATRTEAEVLRRISASNRAGTGVDRVLRRDMVRSLLDAFRERRWPFVVAPYEADGQLAYLASSGLVDVVVTEDSDLIALGVPTLIYRLGGWNGTNDANRGRSSGLVGEEDVDDDRPRLLGTMLRRRDLGSSHGIDLRDFTDGMLATMFVAAGCDYCESLMGIGVVTARNVVKRAFHGCESDGREAYGRAHNLGVPVLRVVLDGLFHSCNRKAKARVLPLDDPEKEGARSAYERSFLAALAMFRHPLVYDPMSGAHVVANDVCDADGPDDDRAPSSYPASALFMTDERILMEYGPYRDLVTRRDALYRVVGAPLAPNVARDVAEGLVDPRRLPARESVEIDASGSATQVQGNVAATQGNDPNEDEDEGVESGYHTQDSGGLQLSTQEYSRGGTTPRRSTPSSSGMISSLSPDLLASPSPQD
ncbi:hypothetical protein ACHAW5_005277 [Stephanodiscus triporus]|uniref:XPG-I domain-containing protein n=1 Tax=Stephanodiscus triporus TaxID=2934178 RepID=A0ABD3P9U4_9STRA